MIFNHETTEAVWVLERKRRRENCNKMQIGLNSAVRFIRWKYLYARLYELFSKTFPRSTFMTTTDKAHLHSMKIGRLRLGGIVSTAISFVCLSWMHFSFINTSGNFFLRTNRWHFHYLSIAALTFEMMNRPKTPSTKVMAKDFRFQDLQGRQNWFKLSFWKLLSIPNYWFFPLPGMGNSQTQKSFGVWRVHWQNENAKDMSELRLQARDFICLLRLVHEAG